MNHFMISMALWTLSHQPVIDIHTCWPIYIMQIIIIDIYCYSMDNIPHVDDKKFKYNVDLCSGVSCNGKHTNECVSDLIMILYP